VKDLAALCCERVGITKETEWLGLALAIGLHLMMEEVVPTKRWNAIDFTKHRVEGDEA
jgi:hypothetical protein